MVHLDNGTPTLLDRFRNPGYQNSEDTMILTFKKYKIFKNFFEQGKFLAAIENTKEKHVEIWANGKQIFLAF